MDRSGLQLYTFPISHDMPGQLKSPERIILVVKAVHSTLQRNIVCCNFAFALQHIHRNDFTTQRCIKHTT